MDDIHFTPTYQIEKFSFATNSVTRFATANGYPGSIRTAAGRVLWVDEGGIWSAPVDDGSAGVSIAHPPLTRALAIDSIITYWAAADREGDSYSAEAEVQRRVSAAFELAVLSAVRWLWLDACG